MNNTKKSICPTCSKVTSSNSDRILDLKCEHCRGPIFKPRKPKIYVACKNENCNWLNQFDAFGWSSQPCQSCGQTIDHPSSKPVGAHLKGTGIKNDTRITIKIPKAEKKLIESLARKHDSTTSAIMRQMIRYFDDRLC